MANIITLKDEQIFEVSTRGITKGYSASSKLAGKTFESFVYNNVVFTVPSEHKFNEDFASGNVASIKLEEGTRERKVTNADGTETTETVVKYTFLGHITLTQVKTVANHKADLMEIEARGAVAMARATAVAKLDATALSTLNALA